MKRLLLLILKLALVVVVAYLVGVLAMRIAVQVMPSDADVPWFFETVIPTLVIGWALVLWLHFRRPRRRTGFWANEVF